MDITLRGPLIISVCVHLSVIGSSAYIINARDEKCGQKKDMVVDYVVVKEPKRIEAVTAKLEPLPEIPETPRIQLSEKVDIKPSLSANTQRKKYASEVIRDEDIAKKQAQIKSTKDYINYYHLIREKIRYRLKKNYIDHSKEGDVGVTFTLTSDGTLISVTLDRANSIADDILHAIAIESIKEAAPFPAFPRAISLPQMSFNLIISFKRY